jgi:predicted NAD/FAD-dependent oxidoreductase
MRIGIIGAGMAGLACAEGLARAGHEVALFDKGRGPGGRMSTRRIATSAGEAQFDHGAQYFTARDEGFRRRVANWVAQGVAAPWPAAGDDAYVGTPGMNAPVRSMARNHAVRWSALVTRIEVLGSGWRLILGEDEVADVDLVVVATPAEQAAALLASIAPDLADRARATPSAPCWTLMLAFSRGVPAARDCWRGDGVIGWAARNSAKPGRGGPESWVAQAGPEWSAANLEANPAWVASTLKSELAHMLGAALPPLLGESIHRWRFAKSGAEGSQAIHDPRRRIGVCGDWLIGPRVEAAWLSGAALAETIRAGAGGSGEGGE